ncbi:AAA family ATPase [Cedecea davisae]|uniref:AAA family ATPase n=1 Tax=Cedecea davisae TaxID=158484 RepID=UPI00376F18A7
MLPEDVHNEFLENTQCRFIKAQRLYDETSKEVKITDFSNDLVNKIKNVSLEAAKISQVLDSSFPTRLFSNLTDDTIQTSSEAIADRLYGLELRKRNYIKYNLIESDDMFGSLGYLNEKISINSRDILDLYINDALDKLAPYEPLYEKIDLFFNLINAKDFAFKKLGVSKVKGFFFMDENKVEIPLSELSSGEQNQVNLYYNMIFGINKSSIILIDEPEISLHVGWQKEFIESIEKIQKINKVANVIIATHSPQIINNRWDDAYFDLFEMSVKGI